MKIRTGQPSSKLSESEFKKRYQEQFFDPAFSEAQVELNKITQIAWQAYSDGRKAPRTQKAGPDFKNPDYDLSIQWKETYDKLNELQAKQADVNNKPTFLIICASPRNDQTCPSEISKTFRLSQLAEEKIKSEGFETDFLDLSRTTAEYGKKIYPCKACVSTAMPLCHWPCSCYPNHSLGQTQDWMAQIYEMWVKASGIMILTPVHWYQSPSPLKLMIDRMVYADGGNPDPTTTMGKDPKLAKKLELNDWGYPKHLKGRAFSVVVHGDTTGDENLRRILVDWLHDLELIDSGPLAQINRYIGYYEPYATSHDALDKDDNIKKEVELSARALVERVKQIKSGQYPLSESNLKEPRKK